MQVTPTSKDYQAPRSDTESHTMQTGYQTVYLCKKTTYHSKLIFVQHSISIYITELPNLQDRTYLKHKK